MRYFLFILFLIIHYTNATGQRDSFTQKGLASYYGQKFHGKKTASGELFDMHSFTAAHKKLPFNTWVKVTNLANKRSVVVRINDRGPFGHNRIIDLSRAAAEKIGMIKKGMVKVKVEVIKPEALKVNPEETNPVEKSQIQRLKKMQSGYTYLATGRKIRPRGYGVEIARFSKEKEVAAFLINFSEYHSETMYIKILKIKDNNTYRLSAGNFTDIKSAEILSNSLKRRGFDGKIRQN